ncbi:hypothetical protein O181_077936, partial [Austropuccinia psidii MF-1]|nr:hypothetical protein [Austropuccinia psidii MF-1]
MDLLLQADKQAEIFHRFSQLAERIRPRLTYDGVNFTSWSKSLLHAWRMYYNGEIDYFDDTAIDDNHLRNLVAISFIENSVDYNVYDSITSSMTNLNARRIYQAIRKRYNKPSWSSIVHHAKTIFNPTDRLDNIDKYAISVHEAISKIENQIGPLNSDKIATFAIYFSVPLLRDHITAALNTRLATNPHLQVHTEDLLDMIRQINTASPSFDHSTNLARINASFPGHKPKQDNMKSRSSSEPRRPTADNDQTGKKKKTYDPSRPCYYCGEMGHWTPTCPVKIKANYVAGLWCDSLSIGIGRISLRIGNNILEVKDVLYCKDIPGIILSIGKLLDQSIDIKFCDDKFILRQFGNTFTSFKKNSRWFLPVSSPSNISSITPTPYHPFVPHDQCREGRADSIDLNLLWHRRMGHLSIRNFNRMMKFNAVVGIKPITLQKIGICHPCSVAKSKHIPIKNPSRQMIKKAGDVIVADLMGPLPLSMNNMKYILMIQDAFSRVVVAIPLMDKSEAKTKLQHWIVQFTNVTENQIKVVRTDNGSEFKNNILDDFLRNRGIIHEFAMPYEHHQNGRIERTNRTISEIARMMLISSNLPSMLWPWAFWHAAWIFNRSLHCDEEKTPFEILGNKKPSLDLLRVFGAKSFIHNHTSRKDLSSRAITGYHLGLAEDSKGWLFWVPGKRTVVRAASATFDENSFYHSDINGESRLQSIQANSLFDRSMINEIKKQDELTHSMTKGSDPANILPTTYRAVMSSPEKNEWLGAIEEELKSMNEEQVFDIVDLKYALSVVPHESILSTKWVFVKKPERYKARLVARGFKQIHGINYDETFAPTPTFNALRLLFSTALLKQWPVKTFDVKVAFLHSVIDKPVFLWCPQGMNIPKFKVLALKKALYGTKQAARCWWLHLKKVLSSIGFQSNDEDPSTYTLIKGADISILWIHVDDGAITASSKELLEKIAHEINKKLKVKWDEEINGLVGITIRKIPQGYKFLQTDLIDKLTGLIPSNVTTKSPLPVDCKLESSPALTMDKPYLKRI